MNAIIKSTDKRKKAKGYLVSSELEEQLKAGPCNLPATDLLIYRIIKSEVILKGVESLTDGMYSLSLFEPIPNVEGVKKSPFGGYATSYRYIGNKR